ncbi:MAG: hypothetical protein KJ968_05550, partial [Nanoarchaeota archaeon]|nr:hypothetical protein [Nanoarchaeota archaeon]
MIGEILKLLPSYVIGGLFFSWLIWAYFFNKDRKFNLNGNIDNVIMILKIFFTIFMVIMVFLFLLYTTGIVLLPSYNNTIIKYVNNIDNSILLIFLILIFFFVMSTTRERFNKEHLKKTFFCVFISMIITTSFYLSLFISSYFSSYRILTSPLFSITILSLALTYVFAMFCSQLLAFKKEIKELI